ncbi:hypothetical protein BpHYR1_004693 [Brachionus plicatilis]|uniref:Uncharacterized protein n=1 Tax=Brachionus plicatilis TaxID=10195 RepID=A0A3M7SJP8_BRAPC|nr:hypothetical protein BpHYR1_004693 [Brachionus plicatilis]
MYYELWFVVVVRNQMENNRLKMVELGEESDFLSKIQMNRQALYNSLNSVPISYNNGTKFYTLSQTSAKTRQKIKALTINLNQSILYEDIDPIITTLKSSIGLVSNSKVKNDDKFEVDYWGQREFIRQNSDHSFDTYWQAFFFIRPENNSHEIFDPTYDYLINTINIDNFFKVYISARSNYFINTIETSPGSDYSTSSDLFYLPCFGSISLQNQILISFLLRNVWLNVYSNDEIVKNTLQIESLSSLTIPYVNEKGSFSVIPYAVRAFDQQALLKRGLYKEPSLNELKAALSGVCDVQDGIDNLFREDSLNYIEVVGTINIDQAKQYLPTITFAYISYFASMNQKYEPSVIITKPSEIIVIENYLVNMIIVTKIYYWVYANTTFEMNSFNYDIKKTQFKISSPDLSALTTILSRKMSKSFARIDLFRASARVENINLILAWLPQITIEMEFGKELSLDEKRSIETVLVNFWTECHVDYFSTKGQKKFKTKSVNAEWCNI